MSYPLLNLASFILGLLAWGLPPAAMNKKAFRRSHWSFYCIASFFSCALALLMQMLYQQHLVTKSDLSALMDTGGAVIAMSAILVLVTLLLNIICARHFCKHN